MKLRRFLVLPLLGLIGCDTKQEQAPLALNGSVQVNRFNGTVTSMDVKFPNSNPNAEINIQSRDNVDRLIEHLEGMLGDIKNVRDHFPVHESPPRGPLEDIRKANVEPPPAAEAPPAEPPPAEPQAPPK